MLFINSIKDPCGDWSRISPTYPHACRKTRLKWAEIQPFESMALFFPMMRKRINSPRRLEITIILKTKILLYFDINIIADIKLREKLHPTKCQICKITADKLIIKTIVKVRMGYHRRMKIEREDKKHYRKCNNCWETELAVDYIFNSPTTIPKLLKIGVLPTTIDLYEEDIELIAKAIIDVHGHIKFSFLIVDTTKKN